MWDAAYCTLTFVPPLMKGQLGNGLMDGWSTIKYEYARMHLVSLDPWTRDNPQA
jgi:hypothetical protein